MSHQELIEVLDNIHKLYEFEMKDIICFYEKVNDVKIKEGYIEKKIIEKKIKVKKEDGYVFLPSRSLDGDHIFDDGKLHIIGDNLYYVNKINYSSIVEIVALFEKYISEVMFRVIRSDRQLLDNIKLKLTLSVQEKIFLKKREDIDDLLYIFFTERLVDDILNGKKGIFSKIYNVLDLKPDTNNEIFINLIHIRNLIAHSNGTIDLLSRSKYKYSFHKLYIQSDNIIKICTYLLDKTKNLNELICKKYMN